MLQTLGRELRRSFWYCNREIFDALNERSFSLHLAMQSASVCFNPLFGNLPRESRHSKSKHLLVLQAIVWHCTSKSYLKIHEATVKKRFSHLQLMGKALGLFVGFAIQKHAWLSREARSVPHVSALSVATRLDPWCKQCNTNTRDKSSLLLQLTMLKETSLGRSSLLSCQYELL